MKRKLLAILALLVLLTGCGGIAAVEIEARKQVRYMAENQITAPEKMKEFNRLNFLFDESQSESQTFIFIRSAAGGSDD